ncbi:DUF6122 family protein [Aquimarina sp. ERC-38]|uniref:DUF6122 family protein n=1 Tax=Aquimarina sp. ERC-38 TaxID=2949996 RepID=UPI002245C24E|nr:DUF6122 family protein [Aquimarina sp. ERC-38]UZO79450.1 DUF6122 family protein [Aquimarina sp. ERC-38]
MLRTGIHYSFHLIIPWIIAYFWYPKQWKKVGLIFIAAMVIDLDHLLAVPIFDPNRCSIGFHPLHSVIASIAYFFLFVLKRTRIIGAALLWHIITDGLDCIMQSYTFNF